MEKQIKKTVKIALIFLAIGLLLGTLIVFAATPSSTFYISGGVYPGAPSYTVWKEGSNYFAKDSTGQIDYSGTNATEIVENAISNGGSIQLCSGIYDFSTTYAWLTDNVEIRGASKQSTIIISTNAYQMFAFRCGSVTLGVTHTNITIKDLTIYGGLDLSSSHNIHLENLNLYGAGIYASQSSNVNIESVYVNGATQGIGLNNVTQVTIDNCEMVDSASYGIDLSYVRFATVSNIILTGDNTSLKIDAGDAPFASSRSRHIVIDNIIVNNTADHYNTVNIGYSDQIQISNFWFYGACTGSSSLRIDANSYNLSISNGYIEASAGITLCIYHSGNYSTFANIICVSGDSGYWSVSESSSGQNYNMYSGLNTVNGALGIRTLGSTSKVSNSWNSTNWIS